MQPTTMKRRPHLLPLPGIILQFWTAQAIGIAWNAYNYERDGNADKARTWWKMAAELTPANETTKNYCEEHAQ